MCIAEQPDLTGQLRMDSEPFGQQTQGPGAAVAWWSRGSDPLHAGL